MAKKGRLFFGFFAEGGDCEGKVYFKAPCFLSSGGHNLAGQFLPHTERDDAFFLSRNAGARAAAQKIDRFRVVRIKEVCYTG